MAKKKVYTIDNFFLGKGYGFTERENGEEKGLFVHKSELPKGIQDEIWALEDKLNGLKITGKVEKTEKGEQLVGCELA